jgi:hypothetical protein
VLHHLRDLRLLLGLLLQVMKDLQLIVVFHNFPFSSSQDL